MAKESNKRAREDGVADGSAKHQPDVARLLERYSDTLWKLLVEQQRRQTKEWEELRVALDGALEKYRLRLLEQQTRQKYDIRNSIRDFSALLEQKTSQDHPDKGE